jgi:hypothetical protein
MPNSTVSAADTGLPNLNRRTALTKLGMGIAGGASLATVASAAPATSASLEILRLIDAHRDAYAVLDEASRRHAAARESYRAVRKPTLNMEGPIDENLRLEWGIEECKRRCRQLGDLRHRLNIGILGFASPKLEKRYKSLAAAIMKEKMERIDSFFAEDEAAQQSSGFDDASEDADRAGEAEVIALEALCSYPCRTIGDLRAKGVYLSTGHFEERGVHPQAIAELMQSAARLEA